MLKKTKNERVQVVLQVLKQEPRLEQTLDELREKVNQKFRFRMTPKQLSWTVRYIQHVLNEPVVKEERFCQSNKYITYQYNGIAE